jgi:acyl carrier protein
MTIEDRIAGVLSGALAVPFEQVDEAFSTESSDRWTSLAHLTVIMALEDEFAVTFADDEAVELLSLPAIREALAHKGVL